MRIGTWIGRVLAIFVALAIWADTLPSVRLVCDPLVDHLGAAGCDTVVRKEWGGLAFWFLINWLPVAFVFAGHGRRRWLWPLGWSWLLLLFVLTFTR